MRLELMLQFLAGAGAAIALCLALDISRSARLLRNARETVTMHCPGKTSLSCICQGHCGWRANHYSCGCPACSSPVSPAAGGGGSVSTAGSGGGSVSTAGSGGGSGGGAGGSYAPGGLVPVAGPPPPRGSGAGMTGFAGAGDGEFEFAVGSVCGLRQWNLARPDFRLDPHQAFLEWPPAYLAGATGYAWAGGVVEAECNNGYAHQPPAEKDPETGSRCGCVSPETRVLTADLRWVPAGDLDVDEHLLAFDEYPASPGYGKAGGRKYRDAVVASTERSRLPCYDLQFEDGTAVRVSADHRWLCYSGQKGAHWVRTDELRAGELRASHVVKPFDVWETDLSHEAGYLAGAFDGEGSLTQSTHYHVSLSFAQAENPMLVETEHSLKELGITYNHYVQLRSYQPLRLDGTPRRVMHRLQIAGKPDLLRFLGSVRPVRLLPKFQPDRLGRLNMAQRVRLVRKTYAGEREVVMLGTTAGTYFAEGMASHNCGIWAYWDMAGLGPAWSTGAGMPVLGVVEGFGRVLLGEKGFRSQRAKILALAPAFSIQAEVAAPGDEMRLPGVVTRDWNAVREEAQRHADAWMAVIQDRLGLLYPGARIFATVSGMLASVPTRGKP